MKVPPPKLLPEVDARIDERTELVAQFWSVCDVSGDFGVEPWEVSVRLRDQVTHCLAQSPPDVETAERLTAQAMLMMMGLDEC